MPVFRSGDQLRPQRIAFHIARDRQEMRIGLDRKRFEAALIDRSGPGRVMVSMPALRVRDGNPPQHLRELSIMPRPEEEMPVIRHQARGGDADAGLGVGLGENLLKWVSL